MAGVESTGPTSNGDVSPQTTNEGDATHAAAAAELESLKRKRELEDGGNDDHGVEPKKPATTGQEGTNGTEADGPPSAVASAWLANLQKTGALAAVLSGDGGGAPPASVPEETSSTGGRSAKAGETKEVDKTVMYIPKEAIGRLIGRNGDTIKDLQSRSQTDMHIDQNAGDDQPRILTIVGPPEKVVLAKEMVKAVMEAGLTALQFFPQQGDQVTQTLDIPAQSVGRLIGKGGETIRELQLQSKARVQIDQTTPGETKKVIIMGDPQHVALAVEMVKAVSESGPQGMTSVLLGPAGGHGPSDPSQLIECPKQSVGRIIGRGGETIQAIQSKTGTRCKVDQDVPDGTPVRITVSGGPPGAVTQCVQMLHDIIQNGPHRIHMYSGHPVVAAVTGYTTPQPYTGGSQYLGSAYGGAGGGGYQDPYAAYSSYAPQAYGGQQQHAGAGGYAAAPPHQQHHYGAQQHQQPPPSHHQPSAYAPQPAYTAAPPQQQQQPQAGGYAAHPAPAPMPGYGAYYGAPSPAPAAAPAAAPPLPPPPPGQPPLPAEWQEVKTPEGHTYWYNSQTQVSTWTRPV